MNKKLLFVVTLIMLLAICLPALAVDGDGTGDGKDVPLMLVSADPGSGTTAVPIDTSITLGFSKNVINMSVRDNNQGQFSLTANGQLVPISVIMADDQMQPEMKRIITISPEGELVPGTTYTLTIGSGMTAKSGAVLGSDVYVTFTTEAAASPAPVPEPVPAPISVENPASDPAAQSATNSEQSAGPAANNVSNPAQMADAAASQPQASEQPAPGDTSAPGNAADTNKPASPADSSSSRTESGSVSDQAANASDTGAAGTDSSGWIKIAAALAAAAVIAALALKMRKR